MTRKWREGKVRPIPGNAPQDRPVSRRISFTFWSVCDDPFPATVRPRQRTILRCSGCVFEAWRNLSVRCGRTQTEPRGGTETPPAGRPRAQVKERVGRNTPCSSSAMSSGRLFLNGLLASSARLRFVGTGRLTRTPRAARQKGTLLLCQRGGHFYFALTGVSLGVDKFRRSSYNSTTQG